MPSRLGRRALVQRELTGGRKGLLALRRRPAEAQRALSPTPPLDEVPAEVPERVQRTREPQCGFGVFGGDRRLEGRAKVREIVAQRAECFDLVGAKQVRLLALGELEEVLRVPSAQLLGFDPILEPLEREFMDRLEHEEAPVLRLPEQTLLEERGERVELGLTETASAASGSKLPAKTARLAKSSRSSSLSSS